MPIRGVHWLAAVTVLGVLVVGGTPASASSGTTIGPVQINPVGHPHLGGQAPRAGPPLFVHFADQCGGGQGQVWQYNGANGHLSSLDTCAGLTAPVAAGITIVRRAC